MDCDEFSVNSHQGYSKQKPSMHRDNPENKSTPFFNMHKDHGYSHKENMMSHSNSGHHHHHHNSGN